MTHLFILCRKKLPLDHLDREKPSLNPSRTPFCPNRAAPAAAAGSDILRQTFDHPSRILRLVESRLCRHIHPRKWVIDV